MNDYSKWLTAIHNTRLVFNTTQELEKFLGEDSIHNNTILRIFPNQQRQRSAFRDLRVEVEEQTLGDVTLEKFLDEYQRTSDFYSKHLVRKDNQQDIAIALLRYTHHPYDSTGIKSRMLELFTQAFSSDINTDILALMLLDALPGFKSRKGDVMDIQADWTRVMNALQTIVADSPLFQELPCFTAARNEPNKTRMMLYYHTQLVLNTYDAYAKQEDYYDVSQNLQQNSKHLELEDFWNTTDGQLSGTEFWQLQAADSTSCYFATHWRKTADGRLLGNRYTIHLLEHPDGGITFYTLHPDAINRRVEGVAYEDSDHTWYHIDDIDTDTPSVLPLKRIIPSESWPSGYKLTRVTDESVIRQYEDWLDQCTIVMEYPTYEFSLSLYAVTQEALFIANNFEGNTKYKYFRIPRTAFTGCERVQLCDKVGILTIQGRQYFAFDDFLLYIPVTEESIEEYGITIVSTID